MGSARIDPFLEKQPPLSFVDELCKPLHSRKPDWFQKRQPTADEVSAEGVFILSEFPDEEGLLTTAIDDFALFSRVYGIDGNRFPIRLKKGETECFEAYRISVSADECTIEAADTEGIRRGIIYVEDELCRRAGPLLPLGTVSRKPYIKTRITRGFFSPTNRPPKNIDELLDDVDYYPDEYLNRLAHDGTNGLWIYTFFSRLFKTPIFPEYGKDSEKRIAKLRRVAAKCKRYGIKVYVFGVEPLHLSAEAAKDHLDVIGGKTLSGAYTICTHTENGAAYCKEATNQLIKAVPDLGGVIIITYGERATTCASLTNRKSCERCSPYSRSELLAYNINIFKQGIREAGSDAEFVSWTYEHRKSSHDEIREYVRKAPSDVALMENFEDAGYTEQLGKTRQAIDYWLSYTGPSQMFLAAAEEAKKYGKKMFAKMQVCCSHELATVPYIPVPGILYDKYMRARELGVQGVMQCWYFGNYPSLMSKAAGELSFIDPDTDKAQFLRQLAGIYCGSRASETVAAWDHFEKGYGSYPVNVMFSYYGPMHDGVVWDLALTPKDRSLPRSWLLFDKPDGDRISECLWQGHTLDEAITLAKTMYEEWKAGLSLFPDCAPGEQSSVAKTLLLLFSSGYNILRFYKLRELLLDGGSDAESVLSQMEEIVDREIENSRQMIPLCQNDPRLGYHSEAEGFKFFPEKLKARIDALIRLKNEDFAAAKENLANGKAAIAYTIEGEPYQMTRGFADEIVLTSHPAGGSFGISYDDDNIYLKLEVKKGARIGVCFEMRPMWPSSALFMQDGKMDFERSVYSHQSVWGEKVALEKAKYSLDFKSDDCDRYLLCVSKKKAGAEDGKPIRLRLAIDGISLRFDDDRVDTLGKQPLSPGEFTWLLP